MLAPTRELAEQIMAELTPFAKAAGHDAASVYGGVGYGGQRKALDRGVELVVACPGRLEDLMQMRAIDLRDVATVVIDEADQMADMGFLPAVRRIVEQTAERPPGRCCSRPRSTVPSPSSSPTSSTTRCATRSARRAPTCTPPSTTSGWSTARSASTPPPR